ncbi:MAG TPA: asparagine synthase-related protein, partial [Sphingomonas sp.]|nr:asparagine synthase-related protein [Sphingomonas sp.]
ALAAPPNPARPPARGKPWGMLPGFQKILAAPASLALGAVRIAQPFRDPRLLTFFSGLPANLLQRRGQDRVPVRHILTGQLPDTIRLQAKGLPISPDYEARLIRQAPEARSRIGRFRRAGIDEWLDLDDLDAALAQIAAGRACDQNQLFKAQLTAMTAEFILWWRDPS